MDLAKIKTSLTRQRGGTDTVRRTWDPPTWLAWAAIVVAVCVWVMVVWGTTTPLFANDDVSALVYGAKIAHPGYAWQLSGSSYMPGMSVLYAPLWAVSDDPIFIARAASIVVGAVGVLTLLPLVRLAQELGLTRNAGMVIAAVTMIAPGRALYGNYYWGETLLALAVALLALTGIRLAKECSVKNAVLFALSAALMLSAHGRSLVVVAVAGVAILALARKSIRVALVGAAVYAVAVAGVLALYRYTSTVYAADARATNTIRKLALDSWDDVSVSAVSQAWYHVMSWWALSVFGVVLLVQLARGNSHRAFARWALAGFGAIYVFVVLFLSNPLAGEYRLDPYAYGRYSEGVTYLLGFLGLVALAKGVSRAAAAVAAVVAVVAGICYLFVVVPHVPAGGIAVPAHMPGLFLWLNDGLVTTESKDPWVWIVVISIMFGLAGAALAKFRSVAIGVMAVYFLAYTVYADAGYLRSSAFYGDANRGVPVQVFGIGELPDGVAVSMDFGLEHRVLQSNYYAYWLYPHELIWFDPATDSRPSDVVIARTDWQVAIEQGALPINGSRYEFVDYRGVSEYSWAWVFPGPVQDELDAEGRLLHRDPN